MKINPIYIIAAITITMILWPDPTNPPAWFHPVKGTVMVALGITAVTRALSQRTRQ